jgi:hypothetical protein
MIHFCIFLSKDLVATLPVGTTNPERIAFACLRLFSEPAFLGLAKM